MNQAAVVTIDGPSGAGKSTISRRLAVALGYTYLDTGAMYRAVALQAKRQGLGSEAQTDALQSLLDGIGLELLPGEGDTRVLLNGSDVSLEIRTPEMSLLASKISALPAVRQKLTALQRMLGKKGAIVAEGRDMGTVVFPEAANKFFLDATPEERARRRVLQLQEQGRQVDPAEILRQTILRDQADSSRDLAPLKPATDAIIVDSSELTLDEVVSLMMEYIHGK
ncbi:MAG: (d)CMP kinase [Proteobacteria bacterium]|nr:(d)CMP kinase [Pseudomonadota bacterium]MBU1687039.1 (d)CMP kinase [Pseudomonadota bacterium]